jgi:ElaB/YqjD/DUF883 family membrane-anchored ribosome-binding protein
MRPIHPPQVRKQQGETMADIQVTREKLLQDFNEVVLDTEQLLKSVSSASGEKAQALRASIEQSLETSRQKLRELQQAALHRTQAAAKATDEYVHGHPWQAIGFTALVAAVLGLVVGLLLNRR